MLIVLIVLFALAIGANEPVGRSAGGFKTAVKAKR